MLYEIMRHCRNFFCVDKKAGAFEIKDGSISLPFILEGQYFLIEGSILNDGVYQYPVTDLKDETFNGTVSALAPPPAFIRLAEEIKAFNEKDKQNVGAFTSESFGGYSYSRATNSKGGIADWHDVYREKLNVWRKI